ncbi:hypothetical protein MMC27_006839 [Xylographa pallens]|nr:hypothetical protein [Xylographa pallens]
MEGQHRSTAAAVDDLKETTEKGKLKRKSRRSNKKQEQKGREQSASDSQHVDGNQGCLPELLPQEKVVENHDKTSAILKSITLPSKMTGKCSNKKKKKTHAAKDSGNPTEPPTQQTRPNIGEPENSTIHPISGGIEPSTSCETTARIEIMNPSETQGTRMQGKHPVVQHPVAQKASPKSLDTIDRPGHELQGTNLDVVKSPENKHKRNYRRLNEKQWAQHHTACKCGPAQVTDDGNMPGAKKVHWVDSVGVESVDRESLSCVANQGSASLQDHSLKPHKSLHQNPSHLNSLDHLNLKHFSSTVSYLVLYFITLIPCINHVAHSVLSWYMNFKLIRTSKYSK